MDNQKLSGVSIIVPLYNREAYIKSTLESILEQERNFPIEILVCDDGSTDRGPEIVRNYPLPVRFLEKPEHCQDQGPAATRNRGIAAAQYAYLAFLDSDDLFLPGHLLRLYRALEEHPHVHVAVDEFYGFHNDSEKRWLMPYPDGIQLESFFLNPYMNFGVAMIRQSVLDEVGGPFDVSLRLAEDVDSYLRILEKHEVMFVKGSGCALREHGGRSIRNIRECYHYAELAMKKAIMRYPYPKSLICKRKAVLQYRFAQADIADKKYVSALFRLLSAFCLDPGRAIRVVLRGNK